MSHIDECNAEHVIAKFRLDRLETSFKELREAQHRIILLLFGNLIGIVVLLATKVSQLMATR